MARAFVTLLYTASYLPGALVLGRTLRALGLPPDTELVVLLGAQLTAFEHGLLAAVYDVVQETSLIHARNTPQLTLLGRPELKPTFTKAQLFALTQYDKVVYLDSDTLPLQKIDQLFDVELRADQIGASPDSGWPDIFNSGVLVVRPNLDTYESLVQTATTQENEDVIAFDGADQGLLNQFFHLDKGKHRDGWVRLPFLFNVTPSGQYQYDPAYAFFADQVKVVHFIGSVKPWEVTNPDHSTGAMRNKWWEKYTEFYGWDRDVKKTIHGIEPRYYQSEPVAFTDYVETANQFEKDLDVTEEVSNDAIEHPEVVNQEEYHHDHEETNQEKVEHQHEHQQEEQAHYQEVLLNPESYQHFQTIPQDQQSWHPSYEEPPKNGLPEAAYFPTDLHYHNQWDEDKHNDDDNNNNDNNNDHEYSNVEQEIANALEQEALHEEYHSGDDVIQEDQNKPIWIAPAVFPWEYENRRLEPERVFNDDGGDDEGFGQFFNFNDLPLIQKIKANMKFADDAVQREEEEEERGNVRNEEEMERLKEIEDRYTGSIEDQVKKDEVIIEQFEKDEEAIVKVDDSVDDSVEKGEKLQEAVEEAQEADVITEEYSRSIDS